MPNGRSGGFIIEAADLQQLVQAVVGNAVVGQLITILKNQPVRATEAAQVIEASPLSRFAVEEQHYSSYIIHISYEPEIVWITLDSESPMFVELRRLHAEWMGERPGWNGWIAF